METTSKDQNVQSGGPVYRVRIIFSNGKYQIKEVIAINKMNLLKSLVLPKQENLVGSYIELKTNKAELLYRTHYEDPSNPYVSVSNDNHTFSQLKSNLHKKYLEVLIPADPSASSLHFMSSGEGKNRCEEVYKISIDEIKNSINPQNRKK